MSNDEAEIPAWITDAVPAEPDTEDKLRRIWELQRLRRKDPVIEKEYEQLRAELQPQLAKEGPRYFIAGDGEKHYAYSQVPERVEVDLEALEQIYENGELPGVDIDAVAPRKVNVEEFRRVVSTGRIPPKIVARVAKIRPQTGFVRFGQGDDA